MNDKTLEELGQANPEIEELLRERRELMQAISYWQESDRIEAPDRVAEFTKLLAELEDEIQTMKKLFQDLNRMKTAENTRKQGGKDVDEK